jgi:integrase
MKVRKFNGHVLPPHVYVKKQNYLYFVKAGNVVSLPSDPSDPSFYVKYSECLSGDHTGNSKRTLGALIESYKSTKKFQKLAKTSRRDYSCKMEILKEHNGTVLVKNFKTPHLIKMLDQMFGHAPSSANKMLAVLRILFKHAVTLGWIQINPAVGVEKMTEKKESPTPWSDAEIAQFHAFAADRESLILELALNTGQRISDVLSLEWSHLTFDVKKQRWGWSVQQQKTGKALVIPFTSRLQRILKRLDNSLDQSNKYVVVNHTKANEPLGYQGCREIFQSVCKLAGLENKKIHGLRHTCAQRLADAGLEDNLIMSMTGHGSSEMVRHYCGIAAQTARANQAVDALDALELAA